MVKCAAFQCRSGYALTKAEKNIPECRWFIKAIVFLCLRFPRIVNYELAGCRLSEEETIVGTQIIAVYASCILAIMLFVKRLGGRPNEGAKVSSKAPSHLSSTRTLREYWRQLIRLQFGGMREVPQYNFTMRLT